MTKLTQLPSVTNIEMVRGDTISTAIPLIGPNGQPLSSETLTQLAAAEWSGQIRAKPGAPLIGEMQVSALHQIAGGWACVVTIPHEVSRLLPSLSVGEVQYRMPGVVRTIARLQIEAQRDVNDE